jgi:hypothetical protein
MSRVCARAGPSAYGHARSAKTLVSSYTTRLPTQAIRNKERGAEAVANNHRQHQYADGASHYKLMLPAEHHHVHQRPQSTTHPAHNSVQQHACAP